MYTVSVKTSQDQLPTFIKNYRDAEKFMEFCKECPNYGTRWSCAPLDFRVEDVLSQFSYISVLAAKISFDEETIASAKDGEIVKRISWDALRVVKRQLENRLLSMEKMIPESMSLGSGSCLRCDACTRPTHPCRHPDLMRHSLDAFGFNLSAIAEDLLQIEILWSHGELPKYYTLVHGILTKDKINESLAMIMAEPLEG